MIRILHVIDHLGLGGAQTALLDMLRHRDRDGFATEVAVMHGKGPFVRPLEEIGVRVHSLSPAKWPPAYVPGFLRLLGEAKPDVLHFHLQGANWIAKPLAALAGAPVRIVHDHTSGDLRFRGVASLLPDAVSHLFSSRVFAVSEGVRDFLIRWEAVSADCIEVIPNGVDLEGFRPGGPEARAMARRRFGVPENAFVAGAMGRLAPEKNLAILPLLAARHPGISFVVAGSGPEEGRLREQISALGVESRVRLLGAVSGRGSFYEGLDVFLLPSLHEGLPMAVIEAMASGVPVLASRLEGISAAVKEESEGLFAGPGDLDDFSRQLGRLAASPGLRRELSAAARTKAAARFSAAGTARRVEAAYRRELAVAQARMAVRYSS